MMSMLTGYRYLTIISLFFWALYAASGYADDVTPQDVSKIDRQLNGAKKAGISFVDCDPLEINRLKPACSKLSDDFCSKLYDGQNDGKMKLPDGEILFGDTRAGAVLTRERFDMEALISCEPRLSRDLRQKVAPVFAEIRKLLAKEEDTKSWHRALSNALTQYARALDDVASARAEAKHPELKAIKEKDLTTEQRSIYALSAIDLDNEIVRAKYEKNPNWERVDRLFGQVKSDLLAEIDALKLPPNVKKRLSQKLGSVTLSLPFQDPRISGASSDCNKTELNAFYSNTFGNFTVCAGLFNTLQSDSALYHVIAHELSHSIDSEMLSNDDFTESEVGQIQKKFVGASGPVFSCDQWDQLAHSTLNPKLAISEPKSYLYQKLTDCFFPNKKLKPFNDENVRPFAAHEADETIGGMVDSKMIEALTHPTILKKGVTVPNEFYLRPDRLQASRRGDIFPPKTAGPVAPQIFVQSLSCQREVVDGKNIGYEQASEEMKGRMLKRAVDQTADVYQAMDQAEYSTCGQECGGLAKLGVSRPSGEHFADWLATRAFPRFLKRIQSLDSRRKAAVAGTAFFCDVPGPWSGSPWMEKILKEYSQEPHPSSRSRRMSLFSAPVAEAVACERDEDVATGDSSCEL
jgi:hypothetical protein